MVLYGFEVLFETKKCVYVPKPTPQVSKKWKIVFTINKKIVSSQAAACK